MVRAMKRRSWPMELPHIGDLPAGTQGFRKSSRMRWAIASVTVDALTRAVRPDFPWVAVFQLSMALITASG